MLTNYTFFPFPYALDGERYDGSIIAWPDICARCIGKTCEKSQTVGIHLCSYGFNHERLSPHLVVGGVIIRQWPELTQARKKRLHDNANLAISMQHYQNVTRSLKRDYSAAEEQVVQQKERIIKEYVEQNKYKVDFVEQLRPYIAQGLAFVHDYKQINAEIAQNINVIMALLQKHRGVIVGQSAQI
jgi:hypothetical protein